MVDKNRINACHTIYGGHSVAYYLGAIDCALREADRIAESLGVERINLHNRLEQMAAFVWEINKKEMQA